MWCTCLVPVVYLSGSCGDGLVLPSVATIAQCDVYHCKPPVVEEDRNENISSRSVPHSIGIGIVFWFIGILAYLLIGINIYIPKTKDALPVGFWNSPSTSTQLCTAEEDFMGMQMPSAIAR